MTMAIIWPDTFYICIIYSILCLTLTFSVIEITMSNTILDDFCERTSIDGCLYIHRSKRFRKCVWIIAWLAMFVLLLWSCINSLILYFRYNVKAKITYESTEKIEFPAITICNINQMSRSVIGNNQDLLLVELLYRNVNPNLPSNFLNLMKQVLHKICSTVTLS